MKIKVQVTELTQENLVDLFSCATYGSDWLYILTPKGAYTGTPLQKDGDAREDMWAKVLLAGKKVYACDYSAEDADDHYGKLPHKFDRKEGAMRYELTLDAVKAGLAKAMEDEYACKYVLDLMHNPCDVDYDEADTLMQFVVFGEVIYG